MTQLYFCGEEIRENCAARSRNKLKSDIEKKMFTAKQISIPEKDEAAATHPYYSELAQRKARKFKLSTL